MKNKGIAPPYIIDNYGWKKTKGIMCPPIIDDYGLQQNDNTALSLSLMCFHNKGIIIQDHDKRVWKMIGGWSSFETTCW